MISEIHTVAFQGIQAIRISVQIQIAGGTLPSFSIVGLPDKAVNESKEILILGPGSAKLELIKHAHQHDAKIAEKIVGVETIDHPSDKEILAYARKFFYKVDQLL